MWDYIVVFYLIHEMLLCICFSIMEKGQEHCEALIQAHRECMLKLGFKI